MILRITCLKDKEKVKAYIDKLPDKKYEVSIKLKKEVRSIPQNRLYWLWLAFIGDETGDNKDDLHEYFSNRFLPKEQFSVLGNYREKSVSTKTLDTVQFTHYLEKIEQHVIEYLGFPLPHPDDLHFAEFYEKYENFI